MIVRSHTDNFVAVWFACASGDDRKIPNKLDSINIRRFYLYLQLYNSPMKLQKYMSQTSVCSRRHAEERIRQGSVFVNGETAHI